MYLQSFTPLAYCALPLQRRTFLPISCGFDVKAAIWDTLAAYACSTYMSYHVVATFSSSLLRLLLNFGTDLRPIFLLELSKESLGRVVARAGCAEDLR